jgi:F-type H+-transporting ATPase subunit alpha
MMYAGINGFLDTLDVENILPFEKALYEKLDTTHSALQEKIINDKKLNDEIEEGMKKVIEETVAEFAS